MMNKEKNKIILQTVLGVLAIIIGGFLGLILLPGFSEFKMTIFVLLCIVLGYLFSFISKKIS
ncbi:hypothetical protein NE686_13055 [Tissierella carlieri]|uniref:Uncharacterized protein n=1 Tax=Tissierella carlieri TaxID=689904 RepID=A0ABT1SC14_9FIRM|nr:hypothetical protein [Tissierella carlieri]MCQ4924023.1 hypothetical protein [Tissierella carlieri]